MKNQVQLITDVDRLAGNRGGLKGLMTGLLGALFGGIDLLPFLLRLIAPMRVSTPWIIRKSIRALVIGMIFALWVEIVADLIVNHMSSASLQFKSFSRRGSKSPFAGMFLAYDRVFPNGAREEDLLRIYRPRPGLPFTNALLESGERRPLSTRFTPHLGRILACKGSRRELSNCRQVEKYELRGIP